MDRLPRESNDASRERLLSRLWAPAPLMPWTRKRSFEKHFTTDACCMMEIARDSYPLEFATFWCPNDKPGACMLASLLLLQVDICRKASADMVIEELVDDDAYEAAISADMSDEERVVARRLCVRALRFWFMYRSDEAAAALEVLSQMLAPTHPDTVVNPSKSHKRKRTAASGPITAAAAAADFQLPGIYSVGADMLCTERDVHRAISHYNMAFSVPSTKLNYTIIPPTVGAAASTAPRAVAENEFVDSDDDEEDERGTAGGAGDTTSRSAGQSEFPADSPFFPFAVDNAFSDSDGRWSFWNINEQNRRKETYFAKNSYTWSPAPLSVARGLFTWVPKHSDWWSPNMAFPNEWPDIEDVKKRIAADHADRGGECPDLSAVTREEIDDLFEADADTGKSVLIDHNTYLPMVCPDSRRRPPLPGLTHSDHTLKTAYPGLTASQHTALCTRRTCARQGDIAPYVALLEKLTDNLFADESPYQPNCFPIARAAVASGEPTGIDRTAKLTRAMLYNISDKLERRGNGCTFGSLMMSHICQIAVEYYQLTQTQSVPFMVMFRALGRLGYFHLGSAIFIANMSEIDTGKTHVTEKVKDSLDPNLIFDYGSATKNAYNYSDHGKSLFVDDAGDQQKDAEYKLRSVLSSGKHSHARNEKNADGNWEVKNRNFVFNNSQYWNTNGTLSAAMYDRTLPLIGQRVRKHSQAATSGERSKLDNVAAPVSDTTRAAASAVTRLMTAYPFRFWEVQALDPALLNTTMWSVAVATMRHTLGIEFKMESRLLRMAENLALSTMAMRVSNLFERKVAREHSFVSTQHLTDGKRKASGYLPDTNRRRIRFYMTNMVMSAWDAWVSLEEVMRNSDNETLKNKIVSQMRLLCIFEEGDVEAVTAPGRDEYWVLSLQLGKECSALADHVAGSGYEDGIIKTMWDALLREKYEGQPIVGTGTGPYKNHRIALKNWILQQHFISTDEMALWRVLDFIVKNRPDMWGVEFAGEKNILFSQRVLELIKRPATPDAAHWCLTVPPPAGQEHRVVPPSLSGSANPKLQGAGALERALYMMAMRPGFHSFVKRDSTNCIRADQVPYDDPNWTKCIPGGLIEKERLDGAAGLKRIMTLQGCVCVPWDDFAKARQVMELEETPAMVWTERRKLFAERCIALDGVQQPGDNVTVGATPVRDVEGRPFEVYKYTGNHALATTRFPNPHRKARADSWVNHAENEANDDEYLSDEEGDVNGTNEQPIECDVMPADEATVKFNEGLFLDVMKKHARMITGEALPDWCDPINTYFPSSKFNVTESDGSAVHTVCVMQNCSVSDTIARMLDCSPGVLRFQQDNGDWAAIGTDVTPASIKEIGRYPLELRVFREDEQSYSDIVVPSAGINAGRGEAVARQKRSRSHVSDADSNDGVSSADEVDHAAKSARRESAEDEDD